MNTLGRWLRYSILGESHGTAVGVLVDGAPAGVPFAEADVQPALDRRRPGQNVLTTQRQERDVVEIVSGVLGGRTTGAPVLMLVRNEDTRSQDYANLIDTPRPGHSDYPARVKYGGFHDPRGGGMFSGRLTAATVMAGALARKIVEPLGVEAAAHAVAIGGVRARSGLTVREIRERVDSNPVRTADAEVAKAMEDAVMAARSSGDSVGGVVECVVEGVPAGIGEPVAMSVESVVSSMLFAVPAVKGVEFGDGFSFAEKRGSEVADPYVLDAAGRVATSANHNGGVLGGITTGMPVRFRAAFKPTSSIPLNQRTLNLATGEPEDLRVKGRHDPCIVPRAVPVVEAVALLAIADLHLAGLAYAPHGRRGGGVE